MQRSFFFEVLCIAFWGSMYLGGCSSADSATASPPPGYANDFASDADADADAEIAYSPEDDDSDIVDREQYDPVGTNPFVAVAHDPFSTFAADVDTASYDIFRRDINEGRLPDPDSIRLEEFVNYFTYDYPPPTPDATHPFEISLAAGPSLFERDTTVLRVGIQAATPPEKGPVNLVFLIDVSGSMTDENKLPLVKRVLTQTLSILDPTDTVSIVTYASDTGVRLPPTPVSEASTINSKINSLEAGGSTAGASGIDAAYEQAESAFVEGGINHVILCTDGDFNVGPSSDDELVSLIESKRATGITLTVLGFGYGNLNDSMMEKVSNAGNGIYAVISSESQADRYVEQRMLSSIFHVAKDMKIQVEFNPDHILAYRLLGYENRAVADDDFRNDAVDGGEVGAGHRVTALFELVPVGGTIPEATDAPAVKDGDAVDGTREVADEDMVLVKVRYKHPGATDDDPAYEVTAHMAPSRICRTIPELDDNTQFALATAAFAEILKESPYADRDALPTIEEIVASKNWLDADRAEFKALFEKSQSLLSKSK